MSLADKGVATAAPRCGLARRRTRYGLKMFGLAPPSVERQARRLLGWSRSGFEAPACSAAALRIRLAHQRSRLYLAIWPGRRLQAKPDACRCEILGPRLADASGVAPLSQKAVPK